MVEKTHTAGWWPSLYEPLRTMGEKVADWFAPRSDALSRENDYEINIELPGVAAKDVEVSVHDNNLVVHGEKRSKREEKGETFYFSEREYGAFHRTFRLPADADGDKIDAHFDNGVLCLRIARKAASAPGARKVEIRGG